MNKQQTKVIAIMLAVALAIAALVLVRGRAPAPDEHAAESTQEEHVGESEDHGVIRFSDAQVQAAGIALIDAGPMQMETFLRMPGQIALNEDRTAHVTPRAAGAVESVPANLGDRVRKGDVLAVIASADVAAQRGALAAAERRLAYARKLHALEKTLWEEQVSARQDFLKAEQELHEAEIALQGARQQLQALGTGGGGSSNRLQIRAPFDGIIVEKHIALGEVVGADTRVFTLTDLSTVWADVVVPAKDLGIVRVGTDAVIRSIASETSAPGKVSFVSSLVGEASRSATARVVLANPGAAWRPGLAVNVDVVTGSSQAAVAVPREAIQTHDGRQVVYRRVKEGFAAQPVATGRSDGRFVEITSGLRAGERVAAAGSFAIKAEQGKGEADHH
ncbi:efflux RND transporter periplasmic adaptor subunit [Massilia sp. ST3]|uniref:efflux RND transporter periplasmic adaptor subunit n=1 Tax=Massilia sp. ST3 TaxID=2824903 RepID=UPI001B83323B|nr:efflux RND transporter periplasmic adaptor subunit [Massilia sp. ST3]MBQ5948083.1 efflux RND transporter periplasmic adaptor subunit [Massilia sp. ST3]